jgi:hypothetical protein
MNSQATSVTAWKLDRSAMEVDDAGGLQDGFYSKVLHADRPSGRRVRWETLQLVITALFPAGFDVEIKHNPAPPHRGKTSHQGDVRRSRQQSVNLLRSHARIGRSRGKNAHDETWLCSRVTSLARETADEATPGEVGLL